MQIKSTKSLKESNGSKPPQINANDKGFYIYLLTISSKDISIFGEAASSKL